MNHTPIATDNLYVCPACSFRAVRAGGGYFITGHGTDDAAHIAAIKQADAQAQAARRAWAERVVGRLRAQYEGRAVLPSAAHDVDDTEDRECLSIQHLQRLTRWVIAEYV